MEQEFDQAFVIQPPDKEDLPGDNVIKESPGPPLDNTVPLSDSTENTAGDKTANIPNIFLSDYTDPAINNTKNTNTATKSAQIITTLVWTGIIIPPTVVAVLLEVIPILAITVVTIIPGWIIHLFSLKASNHHWILVVSNRHWIRLLERILPYNSPNRFCNIVPWPCLHQRSLIWCWIWLGSFSWQTLAILKLIRFLCVVDRKGFTLWKTLALPMTMQGIVYLLHMIPMEMGQVLSFLFNLVSCNGSFQPSSTVFFCK